jgi:hypothetical protein
MAAIMSGDSVDARRVTSRARPSMAGIFAPPEGGESGGGGGAGAPASAPPSSSSDESPRPQAGQGGVDDVGRGSSAAFEIAVVDAAGVAQGGAGGGTSASATGAASGGGPPASSLAVVDDGAGVGVAFSQQRSRSSSASHLKRSVEGEMTPRDLEGGGGGGLAVGAAVLIPIPPPSAGAAAPGVSSAGVKFELAKPPSSTRMTPAALLAAHDTGATPASAKLAAPSDIFGAPAFAAGRAFSSTTLDALMCEAHFAPHVFFIVKQMVRASRKQRLQLMPVADAIAMAMLAAPVFA